MRNRVRRGFPTYRFVGTIMLVAVCAVPAGRVACGAWANYHAFATPQVSGKCKILLVKALINHSGDPWVQGASNFSIASVMVNHGLTEWYQVQWGAESDGSGGVSNKLFTQYHDGTTTENKVFNDVAVPDSATYQVRCNTTGKRWEALVSDTVNGTTYKINWATTDAQWFGEVATNEGANFMTRMVGVGGDDPETAPGAEGPQVRFTNCRYQEEGKAEANPGFTGSHAASTHVRAVKDGVDRFHVWDRRPYITSLNPITGPAAGGTLVTVTGAGFIDKNTKVVIDGTECTATYVNATTIRFTTPAHAAGEVDVYVKDDYNAKGEVSEDAFTFE